LVARMMYRVHRQGNKKVRRNGLTK
jgi:hypothetical protein